MRGSKKKSRTTPPRHWPTNPVLGLDSRSPMLAQSVRDVTSALSISERREHKRLSASPRAVVLLGWVVINLILGWLWLAGCRRSIVLSCSATRANVDGGFFYLGPPKSWDRKHLVIGCDLSPFTHPPHPVCVAGYTLFAGKNVTCRLHT